MLRRALLLAALAVAPLPYQAARAVTVAADAAITPAAPAAITIDNFTFSPPTMTVAPGTRVVWTNRDDIPHTITSADDPKAMKSPPLDTGDSFAFTFTHPGTYRYFCSLHPHMEGSVVVR